MLAYCHHRDYGFFIGSGHDVVGGGVGVGGGGIRRRRSVSAAAQQLHSPVIQHESVCE